MIFYRKDYFVIKIKKPKFYIGIIIFGVVIALSVFAAAPIQAALRIWGLALTELMILICAVVPVYLFKWNIKEVFPIKKPKLRLAFGTFVIWYGTNITAILITLVLTYFFPDAMTVRSYGISNIFAGVPLLISLFIAAVMPSVCEEALHRGFIYYTFQNVHNKWLKIAAIGAIFGLFHLDLYRFLPTAAMGFALTYIIVETKNMVYPVLFHFINNALSVFSTILSSKLIEAGIQDIVVGPVEIGLYLIIASAVPFIFIGGSKLVKPLENGIAVKTSKKVIKAAVIISVILFITGSSITAFFIIDQMKYFLKF